MPRESDLVVFLAAAATWDRYPGLPFLRSFPAPAAAFDRTRDARMRYANILPPADLVVQADLPRRYADGVVPILEDEVRADVASLEAEIRCSAADALQVFIAEIWPEILTLAARDERRIGRSLADDPGLRATAARKAEAARDAALARQAMRAWTSRHGMALVPEASRDVELGSLASRLFRCFLEQSQQQPSAGLKWRASTKDCGDKGSHSVRRREEGNARMAPGTAEEMRHAQRALVDVLLRAVPRRPTRPMSGFRSGRGIDLDSVMRSAATGRDADRIWMRCPVERPALAALLLVDLSGSMRGAKCEAAIAATRLLSMALAEIRGVSWCVMGFQDVTIPFVRFGERPDAAVLARIDEMRAEIAGDRPGGNNEPRYNDDGPCLLEAADELAARPERDRLLIVISDGKPEGRRSDSDDLLQATALVGRMPRMTLWGLGIGPATDHVTRYYAQSQANIALSDIAPAIGRLLVSSLRLTA